MLNPKQIITLLLIVYSSLILAENEVNFDKKTGIAILPHVIIPTGKSGADHLRIELKQNPEGDFFVNKSTLLEPKTPPKADRLTNGRGFYGRATIRLDSTTNYSSLETALPGTAVSVYPEEPRNHSALPPADATPIAKTITDRTGFYQIDMKPGYYKLCFKVSEDEQFCFGAGVTGGEIEKKSPCSFLYDPLDTRAKGDIICEN
ncbi:MAG: hypothetical protein KAH20_10945 [Methylococcales bacterium]|nr:hypothetical protein [Methylococcales bacterium]